MGAIVNTLLQCNGPLNLKLMNKDDVSIFYIIVVNEGNYGHVW